MVQPKLAVTLALVRIGDKYRHACAVAPSPTLPTFRVAYTCVLRRVGSDEGRWLKPAFAAFVWRQDKARAPGQMHACMLRDANPCLHDSWCILCIIILCMIPCATHLGYHAVLSSHA